MLRDTYFKKVLAEIMNEHKLSQMELAKKIGVRQSQTGNYLNGKSLPSYYQIQALSNFFNISADALCDTKFDD